MNLLISIPLAYLLGSLPFGVWLSKLFTGRDVREGGSGHSGGTNTFRQAGPKVAVVVALLDLAKGWAALWLAQWLGVTDWGLALVGAAAVAGHCWPVFAQFRGGMGIATAGGAFLAVYPLGLLIGVALLILGSLLLRHSARGNLAGGLLLGPVLYLLTGNLTAALLGLGTGGVIALRAFSDWRRVYRELWLDREKK